MASNERIIGAPIDSVWAALINPHTYPEWLLGADKILDLDDHWPAVGARFHHRVGFGPIKIDDTTSIIAINPPSQLVLEVRATPLVKAVVTFSLQPQGSMTKVQLIEEPAHRIIGNLVRPVMDPMTHMRNKASLSDFAHMLEQ